MFGGEGGIRTLGESPHDGFQDRYHQPLGHLSISLNTRVILAKFYCSVEGLYG